MAVLTSCCVLALWLAIISVQGDEGWSMKVSAEVRAMEGYPVVLPCTFSHPQHTLHSSLEVVWRLGHAGHGSSLSSSQVLYRCSCLSATPGCQPRPEQDPRYRLEGNPRQHDLSLRINNAALQDSGRYYCRVEVPGHARSSYEDKMGTRLRVEAAPQILGLSVEGSDELGYRALCNVQGSPLPDVQWLGADNPLEGTDLSPLAQEAPRQHSTTSQLSGLVPGQQYTCRASNPLGKDQASLYLLLPPRPEPVPGLAMPPLSLLLSISLGVKLLLLLLGAGLWLNKRGGVARLCCWLG
ncbi:sialic acid-binding Ig-like lectin 15 [Aplochiton taeniatus]